MQINDRVGVINKDRSEYGKIGRISHLSVGSMCYIEFDDFEDTRAFREDELRRMTYDVGDYVLISSEVTTYYAGKRGKVVVVMPSDPFPYSVYLLDMGGPNNHVIHRYKEEELLMHFPENDPILALGMRIQVNETEPRKMFHGAQGTVDAIHEESVNVRLDGQLAITVFDPSSLDPIPLPPSFSKGDPVVITRGEWTRSYGVVVSGPFDYGGVPSYRINCGNNDTIIPVTDFEPEEEEPEFSIGEQVEIINGLYQKQKAVIQKGPFGKEKTLYNIKLESGYEVSINKYFFRKIQEPRQANKENNLVTKPRENEFKDGQWVKVKYTCSATHLRGEKGQIVDIEQPGAIGIRLNSKKDETIYVPLSDVMESDPDINIGDRIRIKFGPKAGLEGYVTNAHYHYGRISSYMVCLESSGQNIKVDPDNLTFLNKWKDEAQKAVEEERLSPTDIFELFLTGQLGLESIGA